MTLFNRAGAKQLRDEIVNNQGDEIVKAILQHFNDLHSLDLPLDISIERMLLTDSLESLKRDKQDPSFSKGLVTHSPSSASKCGRELYFKASHVGKDDNAFLPYQRRWMRNGTAVHAAVQKDLLYAEKYLPEPKFMVERTAGGQPAWEDNIRNVKRFTHNGVSFQIHGMMDGILIHTPTSTRLGFEFKTKSTTISAVGNYKLKEPQASHREQCVAYSLLFDLDEFLIVYESLAKDSWTKGSAARPDMKAFHVTVTDNDRLALLDKFAEVARGYYEGRLPDANESKCIFCEYKDRCSDAPHYKQHGGILNAK